MGIRSSKTRKNSDAEQQSFIKQTDTQISGRSRNVFDSIMGRLFGRRTESYHSQRQLVTQQSDDETPINLTSHNQQDAIAQLHVRITASEQKIEELKTENQLLLTRLSEKGSLQLTEGNPNIADLSDPNRLDKLVEQLSELYDNQWTDTFQVLCERKGLEDEKAITVLLTIILTAYEICRSHAEKQTGQLIESMCRFTGVEVREWIIRESMHNLRNFRAKHFTSVMTDIKNQVEESLQSKISSDEFSYCQDYIAECTKVCWLMCIKSPPMYISTQTTAKFDHSLYTSYTKSGTHVSYVVWPTLFQYENGPILKKGVAQGINCN